MSEKFIASRSSERLATSHSARRQRAQRALDNAGICPGCWYEDARGGWLAVLNEDCPDNEYWDNSQE